MQRGSAPVGENGEGHVLAEAPTDFMAHTKPLGSTDHRDCFSIFRILELGSRKKMARAEEKRVGGRERREQKCRCIIYLFCFVSLI